MKFIIGYFILISLFAYICVKVLTDMDMEDYSFKEKLVIFTKVETILVLIIISIIFIAG